MTQHEYKVVVTMRDRTTKDFQLFAPTRADAVAYIKRLCRNNFKRLVSAKRAAATHQVTNP